MLYVYLSAMSLMYSLIKTPKIGISNILWKIISIRNLSIIISAFMKKDINRERILDLLVLQVVNA